MKLDRLVANFSKVQCRTSRIWKRRQRVLSIDARSVHTVPERSTCSGFAVIHSCSPFFGAPRPRWYPFHENASWSFVYMAISSVLAAAYGTILPPLLTVSCSASPALSTLGRDGFHQEKSPSLEIWITIEARECGRWRRCREDGIIDDPYYHITRLLLAAGKLKEVPSTSLLLEIARRSAFCEGKDSPWSPTPCRVGLQQRQCIRATCFDGQSREWKCCPSSLHVHAHQLSN